MKIKEIIQLLETYKKQFLVFTGLTVFIAFIYAFFIATPFYKSTAKIYPVKDDTSFNRNLADANPILRNLGGGFNSSYKKVDFYIPDLIKSDMIMDKILNYKFYVTNLDNPVMLIDFWKIDNPNLDESYYQAKNKLNKLIDVKSEYVSPKFTISIKTEDPLLSADIIYFIIDQVEDYIVTEKNKLYIDKGIVIDSLKFDYKTKFDANQKDLLSFIKANSPHLARKDVEKIEEMNNKKREIAFDEQAYSFLTTDYIQTNIESASKNAIHRLDVPLTRILDNHPNSETFGYKIINPDYRIDFKKSSPKRLLIVLLSLISSCFVFIYGLLLKRKFS